MQSATEELRKWEPLPNMPRNLDTPSLTHDYDGGFRFILALLITVTFSRPTAVIARYGETGKAFRREKLGSLLSITGVAVVTRIALITAISAIAAPASCQSAAQMPRTVEGPNYSGTYTSTAKPKKGSSTEKIVVAQTADSIAITRFAPEGNPVTNRFLINGTISGYISADGIHGKGRVQWKGGDLILEVAESALVDGRAVPLHMTQRWRLSQDAALLSIKTDVDCPQDQQIEAHTLTANAYSCSMVFRGYPITETYKKNSMP